MVGYNRFILGVACVMLMLSACAAALPLDVCKERAAAGDAEALWQMGQRYEAGDDVRKDGLKAVSLYRKAAEKNHAKACARLAELYATGRVVAKDLVKAARYRAQSQGASGELAAAHAEKEQTSAKVDLIEVALDYIIGRNGKSRDAKKGVLLLYETARGNPTAQRVFVERWERGDLDAGLDTISDKEWRLVLPWFKAQFEKGRHKGGMVLGNAARKEGRYKEAVRYWMASGKAGLTKSWLLLGLFYCRDEKNGGGPKSMRSHVLAKRAFENCLMQDYSWLEPRMYLGLLCLYGDGKCIDYPRAREIFASLMKSNPDDARYLYWYGCAGRENIWRELDARWSKKRVKYLWEKYENRRLTQWESHELSRYIKDFKKCENEEAKCMQDILRAAEKGCKDAEKDYREWKKNRKR